MATRIKTVEYAPQSRNAAALASATNYDFPAMTVVLPEASKTFRSVRLVVGVRDAVTTATSVTAPTIGCQIDAVAFNTGNVGNPPGNTGESGHYVFERDMTSYFTTNYTGTSHSVIIRCNFTGPTTVNHTAKLIITYEYEDTTSATFAKTVRIPLDSGTGALTTSLVQIGTNQIPALDTFLPESGKTYRNIAFEFYYNEQTSGATQDASLGMQVDSGTEHLTAIHESGLGSSCSGWYIWDQGTTPVWATNAVHALNLRTTQVTNGSIFNHVGVVMLVTYTYTKPNPGDTVINSLVLGLGTHIIPGATTAADASENHIDLWIEEPGSITQVQSGALVWYSQSGALNPNIKFGNGSNRTYTDTALLFCGSSFLTQRTDSGGAGGSAWTLARGENRLAWEVFVGTAGNTPSNFGGLLFLNYTSQTAAGGEGTHNKSVLYNVQDSQASGIISTITAAQRIFIPESNWYRSQLYFFSNQVIGTTASTAIGAQFEAESLAGELTGGGWENEASITAINETELGWYPTGAPASLQSPLDFQKYAGDDSTKMQLTSSRRWRITTPQNSTRPFSLWMTYHAITFSVPGTISNSSGGTVTLKLHDATTGEWLRTTTRTGNGSYTITWYDNVNQVYVTARETDLLVGRSGNAVAEGSP